MKGGATGPCANPCAGGRMCKEGIAKGKMCMNFKVPIYNQEEQIVAYAVQTVPLIPQRLLQRAARPDHPDGHPRPHASSRRPPRTAKRLGLFLFTREAERANRARCRRAARVPAREDHRRHGKPLFSKALELRGLDARPPEQGRCCA